MRTQEEAAPLFGGGLSRAKSVASCPDAAPAAGLGVNRDTATSSPLVTDGDQRDGLGEGGGYYPSGGGRWPSCKMGEPGGRTELSPRRFVEGRATGAQNFTSLRSPYWLDPAGSHS